MSAEARPWNRRAARITARAAFASMGVLIVLATLSHATSSRSLQAALDLPFLFVCHRLPERVLVVAGMPTPLCSRCLGLWLGLSVSATLAWPVLPTRALRYVLPIALALMIADVVTQDLGIHPVWHATRIATGLVLAIPVGGKIGSVIDRELAT